MSLYGSTRREIADALVNRNRSDLVERLSELDDDTIADAERRMVDAAEHRLDTGRLVPDFRTVVTDVNEDGTPAITFEPWTDGHAIGFRVTRHAVWIAVRDGDEPISDMTHATEAAAYEETAALPPAEWEATVKHVPEAVSYVYLNPSTETLSDDEFSPDAFVYTGSTGHPATDSPHHYYSIEFEGADPEFRIGPDEDQPPKGNG